MEVLELSGITYVKASSIARDLGYTADYVGQLCRSGKVDAQLVGRSWFVSEGSIRSHKDSRYRSNSIKTKQNLSAQKEQAIEVNKDKMEEREFSVPINAKHFYSKAVEPKNNYTEDQSELIPTLTEKKSLGSTPIEIRHADAKTIPVERGYVSYALKATELPKIRFKGKLELQAVPESAPVDQKDTESETTSSEKTIQVSTDDTEAEALPITSKETQTTEASKTKTISDKLNQKIPLQRNGAITMKRAASVESEHVQELPIVSVPGASTRSGRATFICITTSLLLALTLSAALIFVDQTIVMDDASAEKSIRYSLNISAAIESIFP
jgi:hypothetical protein